MKLFDKKRLLKLIEGKSNIPTQIDLVSVGGNVQGEELLETYTRRRESAGELYDGFENLLMALQSHEKELIRVHIVQSKEKSTFVFTDKKIGQIFAILTER